MVFDEDVFKASVVEAAQTFANDHRGSQISLPHVPPAALGGMLKPCGLNRYEVLIADKVSQTYGAKEDARVETDPAMVHFITTCFKAINNLPHVITKQELDAVAVFPEVVAGAFGCAVVNVNNLIWLQPQDFVRLK